MADGKNDVQEALRIAIEPYVPPEILDALAKDFAIRVNREIKAQNAAKAQGQTGDTSKQTDADPNARDFFAKLFPKLGLETKDGKFTNESLMGAGSKMAGGVSDGVMTLMKTGVGILEDIYKRVSAASPLLQAVESLFNLAMQLFFMPLGNAFGEKLIPAALDMIDDVMEMWESMEGKSLEEILNTTISKGVEIVANMLLRIGKALSEQNGIVGSIGKLFTTLGNFVQNNLKGFLDFSIGALNIVINHFKEFISLFVAFKAMSLMLGIAQIAATLSNEVNPFSGKKWAGYALLASVGAFAATEGVLDIATHAEGGYVASPQVALLGEGGEGEWVVPDSKVSDFVTQHSYARNINSNGYMSSGGDNYTINVYGYTDSELSGIIENKVNELSNRSRLRSGF